MRLLLLLISALFLFASDVIIQYPNLKKEYYQNQIIDLKIKIILPKQENISFIPPPNSEINVTKTPNIYYVDLKYKNIPNQKLFIFGGKIYKEIDLNTLYKTKTLDNIDKFCHVLADELNVSNTIATKDSDKIMLSFVIKAKNANLKDFRLNFAYDQNLTLINKNEATFFGKFDNTKKVTFYYFNTKTDNFEKIEIPIILKIETISTQTNLNPEEKTFFTPVNMLLLGSVAFILILFLVYQRVLILIPALLITAFLIYINLPKGTVVLPPNTTLYILPTKNSTPFYTTTVQTTAQVLKKYENYTKVKIKNKIGWVKNETIAKH